jgi:microcystin-dependent protein
MSNYTKATNFATKDTLPTGDSNKIVKGTEIDNEFNSISGAISSKADIASPTFTGTPAAPTATAGSNTTQVANTAYVRGELTTLIPSGIILLWSGSIASIPSGWVLCNGANSTPDLRDRFVVGAGTTYAVNATGGANTVTLDATMIPAHTHSLSASGTTSGQSAGHTHTFSATTEFMNQNNNHTHGITDPGHSHLILSQNQAASDSHLNNAAGTNSFSGTANGNRNTEGTQTAITINSANIDHKHDYSGTTSAVSGDHTHTVTVTGTSGSIGGGLAHENRPPYLALAYIMKT